MRIEKGDFKHEDCKNFGKYINFELFQASETQKLALFCKRIKKFEHILRR